MKKKEYALYKGENCLAIGSIKEIAKQMGVKENTIKFYMSPVYIKRRSKSKTDNYRTLVCLDDDEDIDIDNLIIENRQLKKQNKKLLNKNKKYIKAINDATCCIRIYNEISKDNSSVQILNDLLQILEKVEK